MKEKIQGSKRPILWYTAGVLVLLAVWEIASLSFGSALIFPGPLPVLVELLKLFRDKRFLVSVGSTFFRVLAGMIISVPLGLACGIAAGLDKRADAFLRPLFSFISATPVMSVILIAFLFLGAEKTPVFTALLMVFPVMAANSAEGIRRVDPQLAELFRIYKMTKNETLRRLYIPSITPFILGGLQSSLSLCWKVVVAAEVLVQPLHSLGTNMQQAKARLETPELFAWTLVTVISAALLQGLLGLAASAASGKRGRR
ncbi:MAG: ABC transporter permease subunit [Treponema sp.]|nr:ABC transporter permease subunit [Treponema sp.]